MKKAVKFNAQCHHHHNIQQWLAGIINIVPFMLLSKPTIFHKTL